MLGRIFSYKISEYFQYLCEDIKALKTALFAEPSILDLPDENGSTILHYVSLN